MTRDLQHTFFDEKLLRSLNDRRHPGKRKFENNEGSQITIENKDADEDGIDKDKTHPITGENLLSLNIGDEGRMGTPSQAGSTRRGDLMV